LPTADVRRPFRKRNRKKKISNLSNRLQGEKGKSNHAIDHVTLLTVEKERKKEKKKRIDEWKEAQGSGFSRPYENAYPVIMVVTKVSTVRDPIAKTMYWRGKKKGNQQSKTTQQKALSHQQQRPCSKQILCIVSNEQQKHVNSSNIPEARNQ
jgi:hypothetical protein